MTTLITHALAILVGLVIGAALGWYGKGKFGAKADAVILDVRQALRGANRS